MNHVLLWSQRQNALHIETLEHHLSLNRRAYRDNHSGDYRVMYIGAESDVHKAADAIRNTIGERAAERHRETA